MLKRAIELSSSIKAELNAFVREHKLGTAFGNDVKRRFFGSDRVVKNAYSEADAKRFRDLSALFRSHGDAYHFDWLMLMAQGYQDISGQIIRGVMKLVDELESALGSLVRLSGASLSLVGTVVTSQSWNDRQRCRVVGGKNGMGRTLGPAWLAMHEAVTGCASEQCQRCGNLTDVDCECDRDVCF